MVNPAAGPHEQITFAAFVRFLEKVAAIKPRKTDQRTYPAQDSLDKPGVFFKEWADHLEWPVPTNTGKIIFRLLFPEQDIRRKYNLQETRLAKYLVGIFHLSSGPGQRGEPLLNWNTTCEDHHGVQFGKDGCLGLELQKIRLDVEYDQPQSLRLSDVDRLLDELAAKSQWSNLGATTFCKPARQQTLVLKDIFEPLSARESAYMTQIILKDLRPLLYPLPSLSSYISLMDYNHAAFHQIDSYSIMKAWHWAMPRIYRAQADFDKAAALCEQIPRDCQKPSSYHRLKDLSKPELGVPVNIPKAVKASGSCLASPLSKLTGIVWAETKMDGERMQIHVDTSKPKKEQIKIFSKSHRDSTKERASTLIIIRATLGLDSSSNSEFIESHPRSNTLEQIKSGIFEAEVVAWNKSVGKVDEFWRIAELKLKPWQVHRCDDDDIETIEQSTVGVTESQMDLMNTQQLDDLQSRHLALCFFDVLYLNDESFLEHSYYDRWQTLEKCVHIIPHYSMLVERKSFDFSRESGRDALRKHYATVIAERHEGLMLKTAESVYNDHRPEHKWLKVKKDYINGFGDTADYSIIGAAWDRDRGRELRVSTSTYTIWYVGLCDNVAAVKRDPSILPNFRVVFTSMSYGLARPQLEKANRMVSENDGQPPSSNELRSWPFTYNLAQGLKTPTIIFRRPLVFELMGSGFTKRSREHEYELRWPRITKLHEPEERDWSSTIDLEEHNSIARIATHSESLKIADAICCRNQGPSETGFQAELDRWNKKLFASDMDWLGRSRNLPIDKPPTRTPVTGSGQITTLPQPTRAPVTHSDQLTVIPKVLGPLHQTVPPSTPCIPTEIEIVDLLTSSEQEVPKTITYKKLNLEGSSERNAAGNIKFNLHVQDCTDSNPPESEKMKSLGPSGFHRNPQSSRSPGRRVRFDKSSPERKLVKIVCPSRPKVPFGHVHSMGSPSKRSRHDPASISPTKSPARLVKFTESSSKNKSPGADIAWIANPLLQSIKPPSKEKIPESESISAAYSPVRLVTSKRKRSGSSSIAAKQPAMSADSPESPSNEEIIDLTGPSPVQTRNQSRRARLVNFVEQIDHANPASKIRRTRSEQLNKGNPCKLLPPGAIVGDSSLAIGSDTAHVNVSQEFGSKNMPKTLELIGSNADPPMRNEAQIPTFEPVEPPEEPYPTAMNKISDVKNSASSLVPPWRTALDVRWCLVNDDDDDQNHGIVGTRYYSVAQLLRSLETTYEHFISESPSEPVYYIFIRNPALPTIRRIQKQILFRALSNPNIAIVGYDAKALDGPQDGLESWIGYELFRFDSYARQYQLRPQHPETIHLESPE